MTWARRLRALLRVEWRQLRRNTGRSVLIAALVALPVAAIVGGSTLAGLMEPNAEERVTQMLGQADLRVAGSTDWEERQRLLELLPDEARIVHGFSGLERVTIPGRRLRAELLALPPEALIEPEPGEPDTTAAGLAFGMVRLVSGRVPQNSGEVALSPVLLEALDRSVGGRVALEYGAERVITGVVVDPEDLSLPLVLRPPAHAEYSGMHFSLVRLGETSGRQDQATTTAESLRSAGFSVSLRADLTYRDDAMTAMVYALGAIGLFEAGLVIAAAFAVGLRRRQVEIGLLGSTGASAGAITQGLLCSAALLALLGGLVGTLLGVVAIHGIHPWLADWLQRLVRPVEIVPGHVIGALMLGVVAAVAAAVLPAWRAARLPIRLALAGRKPSTGQGRGWLLLGLSLISTGIVLRGLASSSSNLIKGSSAVGGPILCIVGFGACAPWLLGWLARLATRLPLAWRLAVRDAGRFRARNGAVVTAVLAGMAMSVTVAALVSSLETAIDAFPERLRDDHLLIRGAGAAEAAERIADVLPTQAVAPLAAAYTHGEPLRGNFGDVSLGRRFPWVAVGGESLARALGAEGGLEALAQGHLLLLDPPVDTAPQLTSWFDDRSIAVPPTTALDTGQKLRQPIFLLGEAALEELDLEVGPPVTGSLMPWLIRLQAPVTPQQLEQARELAARSARASVDAQLLHANPLQRFYRGVLALCVLTGLLVVFTATALSAVESAADERILETVGAAPRLLRRHLAARASYLALIGCALAIPAGLLAAMSMVGLVTFPIEFVVPWRDLAVTLVAFPALVYLGAWSLGSPSAPVRRLAE